MAKNFKMRRSAQNAWLTRVNPLSGLTIAQAKSIFDAARAYGSPLLQKIYDEIESCDATLMTCVERRGAALSGLGWTIKARASADAALAEEQRDALDAFAAGIDNLSDAIEHLDLAFFRRHAHCQPIWDSDTCVRHIELLDSWNFLFERETGWWWNPDCRSSLDGCEAITPAERLVTLARRRCIDWPALTIYIRKALAERDWGRYLERFGIPSIDVIMPPNATNENKADFVDAAEDARDGLPSAWPNGTDVRSRGADSRGQDPFTSFIEYQNKQIVLAATGGTLTSLAQADTGALAGGAQMDVWREIVARDAVVIGDALMRQLFAPYLRAAFPGRAIAAVFEIGREEQNDPRGVAELAATLKTAGYTIDAGELAEAVGFTLEKDAREGQTEALAPLFNKAAAPSAFNPSLKPLKTAPARSEARGDTPDAGACQRAFLAAFAQDTSALANEVRRLMANPTPEAARALTARLPELVPDDPALAAVIAEEMAGAFGAREAVTNKGGVCTSPNGPEGCKSKTCPGKISGTDDEDDHHTPEEKQRIKDYEASTDQRIVDFYERMKSTESAEERSQAKCHVGIVSEKLGSRIYELTGIDTTGWEIEIRGERARHLDIRHGGEGIHDHSLANPNDIGRINYVLQNFDSVSILKDKTGKTVLSNQYQGRNGPAPVLDVRMKIDGTYAIQEAIPESKWKKIYIVSARIEKSKRP